MKKKTRKIIEIIGYVWGTTAIILLLYAILQTALK
jgi:hypothetical protein